MVDDSKKKDEDTRDKFKTSGKKPSKKVKSVDPCQDSLIHATEPLHCRSRLHPVECAL